MGGFGSGDWVRDSKAQTVEACTVLDVVTYQRQGILVPDTSGSTLWRDSRTDEVSASLDFRVESVPADASRTEGDLLYGAELVLWLSYTITSRGQRYPVEMPVLLKSTCPPKGGKRYWFSCSLLDKGESCRRRVRKLYLPPGAGYFGCRQCHRLSYRSCQKSGNAQFAAQREMRRIAAKLGVYGQDAIRGNFSRPKGMHRSTYRRLANAYFQAMMEESAAGWDNIAKFEPFLRSLTRFCR